MKQIISRGPIYKISCDLSSDYRIKIDRKSVVSSTLVILYDLSYSYRNHALTLSYDNPTINLIVR